MSEIFVHFYMVTIYHYQRSNGRCRDRMVIEFKITDTISAYNQ